MSGLYQYFLTTVLLVAVALFTTLMFYPRAPPDPSVAVQNVIDGTHMSKLSSAKVAVDTME